MPPTVVCPAAKKPDKRLTLDVPFFDIILKNAVGYLKQLNIFAILNVFLRLFAFVTAGLREKEEVR